MTKLTSTLIAVAGLALSGSALPGCAPPASAKAPETAGQYIDDLVITTKVKAAFLEESSLKSFEIGVKTYKDVVQLSGFVDSARSVQLAGQLASRVKGVSIVKNNLIVK